jgi:hypothetical protein
MHGFAQIPAADLGFMPKINALNKNAYFLALRRFEFGYETCPSGDFSISHTPSNGGAFRPRT